MVNRRNWFYKTLFSYLPIFIIISTILFLLFFFGLSEYIKKSTIQANQVLSEQINQAVENPLMTIDKFIINEIINDEILHDFFREQHGYYTIYQTVQKLNSIMANHKFIDSIYVFRESDSMILTNTNFTYLDKFSDRSFIVHQLDTQNIVSWSGKKLYRDPTSFTTNEVISLVRKVPIMTGEEGLFVVNIRVDALRALVSNMLLPNVNYINFTDASGELIFSTEEEIRSESKHLTRLISPYTGWEVESGIKKKYAFNFFSSIHYIVTILGLILIAVGVLLFVYVTRRNYKPIESIIDHIHEIFANKKSELLVKGNLDEMRFISLAIDNLLEQTNKLQNKFEENQINMRRHFFIELIEGIRQGKALDWQENMENIGLEYKFTHFTIAVLEIDKYFDFSDKYSVHDQYLLKFVLCNVINEIAQEHEFQIWSEYISVSRLGILVFEEHSVQYNKKNDEDYIRIFCNKVTEWAVNYLDFTVTIGIGGTSDHIDDVHNLYEDAIETLKYKSVLGNSRVIQSHEMPTKSRPDIFHYVHLISSTVRSFRLGEASWEDHFLMLLHQIKIGVFSHEDVSSILHYLIYNFDREVLALSEPIREYWRQNSINKLNNLLEQFDTLEEFQEQALQVLNLTYLEINSTRENSINHQLINNVKIHINEHHANPDLSLNQLSDQFNLSTRYLSRIFKEESGEKLIDFMVGVRMKRAKELLIQTEDSIQDIAFKVGYVHSFSFIRMFKKNTGLTPGDFRK